MAVFCAAVLSLASGQDLASNQRVLVKTTSTQSRSIPSQSLLLPMKCDSDGRLYLQFMGDPTAPAEDTKSVLRISKQAEVDATFALEVADLGERFSGRDYAIGADGQVSMLAETPEGHFVVQFDSEGKFRKTVQLEDRFRPFQLALFKSGGFLIAGTETPKENHPELGTIPFTGIFDERGKFLKEVSFSDDKQFASAAQKGDARYVAPQNKSTNRAVTLGEAVSGDDGNVYLLRWGSPAIVYVVSPGGEVVRRLTIDPGNGDMRPRSLFVSNGRVAIQFADSKKPLLVVANASSGVVEATYASSLDLGSGLACYTTSEVTFVGNKEGKLSLNFAQPK